MTRDRRWYLIDVWRKRVDYPELKAAVQTHAAKYKAKRVLVEDAGAGTSLAQELRRGKVSGIVAVKPERDKVSRMAVVATARPVPAADGVEPVKAASIRREPSVCPSRADLDSRSNQPRCATSSLGSCAHPVGGRSRRLSAQEPACEEHADRGRRRCRRGEGEAGGAVSWRPQSMRNGR